MKGKIRKYIPILMWTALLLAAGCGAPPVPPSDEDAYSGGYPFSISGDIRSLPS